MKCRKTRKLLGEYIDGSLDSESAKALKAHVTSCDRCARELETLRSYREKLATLRDAKAPAGFLIGVKNRIETAEEESPKRRAFFSSPRIKVPLELAGAVAVVLIAVVIFRNVVPPRERQLLPTTQQMEEKRAETAEEFDKEEKTESIETEKGDFDRVQKPAAEEEKEIARGETAARERADDTLKAESPTEETYTDEVLTLDRLPAEARTAQRADAEVAEAEEPKKETSAIEELAAVEEAPEILEERLLVSAPAEVYARIDLTLRIAGPPPEGGEKDMTAMKSIQTEETVYRDELEGEDREYRKNADLYDPSEMIGRLADELGGMVLSLDYDRERDLPRYVTIQIPSVKYKEFIYRLDRFGELEAPAFDLPEDEEEPVVVRIEISR
jgi:hypothetical protein